MSARGSTSPREGIAEEKTKKKIRGTRDVIQEKLPVNELLASRAGPRCRCHLVRLGLRVEARVATFFNPVRHSRVLIGYCPALRHVGQIYSGKWIATQRYFQLHTFLHRQSSTVRYSGTCFTIHLIRFLRSDYLRRRLPVRNMALLQDIHP